MVSSLTIKTELWRSMNKDWPKMYAEFRERASVIITMAEVIAQEMGEKNEVDQKKGLGKKDGDYKAPGNLKSFLVCAELQENLKRVMSVSIDTV
ncbi:hypothetical protein ACS0TY_012955 [Phlomoides rotata]